jgi:hypothetical protein
MEEAKMCGFAVWHLNMRVEDVGDEMRNGAMWVCAVMRIAICD